MASFLSTRARTKAPERVLFQCFAAFYLGGNLLLIRVKTGDASENVEKFIKMLYNVSCIAL